MMFNITKSIIMLLLSTVLYAGVSTNGATLKVVGVDRLPTNDSDGYMIDYFLDIDGAAFSDFPGGIKNYHARGQLQEVRNGVVTINIDHNYCGNRMFKIEIGINHSKILNIRKKIPCNQITIIRIK